MLNKLNAVRLRRSLVVFGAAIMLASCQAATTMLDKQDLDIQTHMSETIFLDPVAPNKKVIYVSVRNTSDHPELDLKSQIIMKLTARGYTVVEDPKAAHFLMQLNIIQAGPVDPQKKNSFLSSGYGSALESAVTGAAAGALTTYATGSTAAGVGVGAGIGIGSFIADRLVKDVFFTVVADIQISVRPEKGTSVKETTTTARLSGNASRKDQGNKGVGASESVTSRDLNLSSSSNGRTQSVESNSEFIKYNVRDVAYANQVNLKWENASPVLIDRISSSVANLYE
ncbi:complement resistance protein TraT [Magnetospirillum molischianum]|uniref:Putative TraT complement resistance protein n=1 Tax=Magnetospirillum molischianum DSM 120 TaxID=1150626 RepID=H8FPY7_MAGML|nr:complement resistance protein TraT [Magnetospirillum molischianum]CCG40425.1 putative TraT complement resistance protein [Magnetospirillum molischianum DSM 120]